MRTLILAAKYGVPYYVRWLHEILKRAVKIHQSSPVHLIYSRSLPSWAHVAGYWVSKETGVPWVANINDPWDGNFSPTFREVKHGMFSKAVSMRWLKRTLKSASLITYPSIRLAEFHRELSGVNHKYAIIPHIGCKINDDQGSIECFHLVHAGVLKLGTSRRSIEGLLLGLRIFLDRHPDAKEDTRLTLVGPEDDDTRRLSVDLRLESAVAGSGLVSYEESLRFIRRAAVCVLVEANLEEGIYFPSKLADYLVATKPVLALSPESGVVADLARNRGIVRVNPDDAEGVAAVLSDLYVLYKDRLLGSMGPSDDLMKMFAAPMVAEKFMSAISPIVGRSRASAR